MRCISFRSFLSPICGYYSAEGRICDLHECGAPTQTVHGNLVETPQVQLLQYQYCSVLGKPPAYLCLLFLAAFGLLAEVAFVVEAITSLGMGHLYPLKSIHLVMQQSGFDFAVI